MLKVAVVLCALIVVSYAAQAIAPLDPIPDKFKTREGCYIKEHDKVIKVGESIDSKKSCSQFSCGKQYVTISNCGVVQVAPPCKIVKGKIENPYPLCCNTIKCPTKS